MLNKLCKDPSAAIFGWARIVRINVVRLLGTFVTRVWCAILGISVGKETMFIGIPDLRRAVGASILIGKRCNFRSGSLSNKIGVNRRCLVGAYVEGASVRIGSNCGFNGTVIGCTDSVTIGDGTLCGANTLVTDFDWHLVDPSLRHSTERPKHAPVVIEENVWLGYGVVVLKGVRIGKNSVITANSIVVKDIPANVVAGGNPARVISQIKI